MTAADGQTPVRRRVIYAGRVQGVFFRATSAELSRGFDVVGGVRNLRDGTVELEAEGAPDEVARFLDAIGRHFQRNITRSEREDIPVQGSETRFDTQDRPQQAFNQPRQGRQSDGYDQGAAHQNQGDAERRKKNQHLTRQPTGHDHHKEKGESCEQGYAQVTRPALQACVPEPTRHWLIAQFRKG